MERALVDLPKKKKKSSAKKLESLWKKWLDTEEATAKVSYELDYFIYSFVLALFPQFSNHVPQPTLRQCWQTFQQRALDPWRVGGTILKMAALTAHPPPKKKHTLASHRDKSITCISIQAKSPSDQKHLPMADVLPARMLPDKTIAYQNLNNSHSHVMKQAKAEWKGYLSLSFSSFLASLVVLNQSGDFCSQGEIWQRLEIFLSVILEGRRDCYWHLIGGGQGCW